MRVPSYKQQVDSLSVPTVAAPNIPIPNASTQGDISLARDTQGLGEAIGKIGSQVAERVKQRQEIDFKQKSADLKTDWSNKLNNKLFSTDMETYKDAQGNDAQRPVGVLNWKGNNAVGAHQEFERYAAELAPTYANQFKGDYQREFLSDLGQIKTSKAGPVLTHESNEWNTAKTESFKGAISQAVKDGNIVQGDKAAMDLAHFQGVDPAELVAKTRIEVVKNAAMAKLEADPTGKAATDYIDSLDVLDPKDSMDIKKDVAKTSKSLLAEQKLQKEATQSANFVDIVGGVIDGKLNVLNADSINKMSLNGDLPDGAAEAVQNFMDASRLSPSAGNLTDLDDSIVNHARAVLSVTKPGQLNQAIIDIMSDSKMSSEEGRKRAVVLLQVAKELGVEKNADARQKANDSLGAVMSWYDKAGIPTSTGVLDFMKMIRSGVDPKEAAQQTINQELTKQGAGKDKDAHLTDVIYDAIDGRGHFQDITPAVNAYLIKSGMLEPDAAQTATGITSKVDFKGAESQGEIFKNLIKDITSAVPSSEVTANLSEKVARRIEQKHVVNMIALDKSPAMDEFRVAHPYAYAMAVTLQDAGVAGAYFLDGLTAQIPSYILAKSGYELPHPESGGGKALAGLGSLAGFVTGLPGKVGQAVASKVFQGVKATGFIGKTGVAVAKGAVELGTMTAVNTPKTGIADWRARGEQFLEGAGTGAAFGALGTISSAKYPKITQALRMGISSLWTGIPSTMAKQSVEEQVFQYGLGAYFGVNGINFKDVEAIKTETADLAKEVKDPAGKEALNNTVAVLEKVSEPQIKEKSKALKAEIPSQYQTGSEPALLDYLHLYMPAKDVAKMSPSERLTLGNMPWQQFRDTIGARGEGFIAGQSAVPDPNAPKPSGTTSGAVPDPNSPETKFAQKSEDVKTSDVGGGKPPEKGLVVANIGSDGKIYYGQPGELHFNLSEHYGDNIRKGLSPGDATWKEIGFAGPDGKFLSREEALKVSGIKTNSDYLDAKEYQVKARPDTSGNVNLNVKKNEGVPSEKVQGEKTSQEVLTAPKAPEVGKADTGGKDKTYGLAKSTEQRAIEAGLVEDLGHLPEYQQRPIVKEKAAKVQEFIAQDSERAVQIALGNDSKTPEGLSISEIYSGVRSMAEKTGDIQLIRELAQSEQANRIAKEAGQFVKGYDSAPSETSTTKTIQKLSKELQAAAEKKVPGKDLKKAEKTEVEAIKEEKKKAAPKIKEWSDLIESLRC